MKSILRSIGFTFILSVLSVLIWSGCNNSSSKKISIEHRILPEAPDLAYYDAVFVGENHFSAQIYENELDLMKYYYSLGIRDFAFECSFGEALFFQYYFESGDEECLEYLTRFPAGGRISYQNVERGNFYRSIYQWNSGLEDKITIHGFDIEYDSYGTGAASIWFFILRKYDPIEGIPVITAEGNAYNLIDDFRNNWERYSALSSEDMELFGEILVSIEQGELSNSWNQKFSKLGNLKKSALLREQFMALNFRSILRNTQGRKVLAIMGYFHSSLTGKTICPLNERQFPYVFLDEPCMANVLKDEIKIASIVLRTTKNPEKWPYFIRIHGWKLAEPKKTRYKGNWPYS